MPTKLETAAEKTKRQNVEYFKIQIENNRKLVEFSKNNPGFFQRSQSNFFKDQLKMFTGYLDHFCTTFKIKP